MTKITILQSRLFVIGTRYRSAEERRKEYVRYERGIVFTLPRDSDEERAGSGMVFQLSRGRRRADAAPKEKPSVHCRAVSDCRSPFSLSSNE